MTIALRGVTKSFDDNVVLTDVQLDIQEGELFVVVGPSGSGKTTLLRSIAGLEKVDKGRIEVRGRDVTALPPGDRDVAMVFQEYALYPHLDVVSNIAFGLRARRVPKAEVDRLVQEVLGLLRLQHCARRRPDALSGGERQRVALARAIVRDPAAFLMDEPLANLDAELRTHTRTEIRTLQERLGTTTVLVTHDQAEAFTLGHRIAVLRSGRVVQVGTPRELYDSPANTFVARFIGTPPMNLFPGETLGRGAVTLGLRPDRIRLVEPAQGMLTASVTQVEELGSHDIVHVVAGESPLLVATTGRTELRPGGELGLMFHLEDLHHFDGSGLAVPG